MSIAEAIEVLAERDTVEHAVEAAVRDAGSTVRLIKHVYVDGLQAIVEENQVQQYRVNAEVTSVVE